MTTPLPDPQVTETPTRHPTICLALSTPLLSTLRRILPPKPHFTLSIGSGTGLLEALLVQHDPSATIAVEGVEVDSAVNRYIPEQDMHVVPGAWATSGRALAAAAWLFVYPREVGLVGEVFGFGNGFGVDWPDYEGVFAKSLFSALTFLGETEGLAPYEVGVVARRSVS
ncbi:hypothetical protein N7510_008512 [Penicillium lagena]|uniref:uncharacterized protein n=1 Tax=Penicillium lagena TaxID=94218 RepID=UPI002541C402|nr:uncharacterized protein N7510_008512 [Penicillium lagena]KAJ5605731.1 hypothetical protein N7510_008512 [Penicillium lagena]